MLHLYKETLPELGSQASMPGGFEGGGSPGGFEGDCLPGPHAEEPSNPNQDLPDWDFDTSEEACQQTGSEDAPDPNEQVRTPTVIIIHAAHMTMWSCVLIAAADVVTVSVTQVWA